MKKEFLGIGLILASLNLGTLFAASNISIEQAKAIALKKVPGATITNIELDYENNKSIYDIDLVLNQYEYDLKLDATTGSGISVKKELRNDTARPQTANFITTKQAQAIALKKVPGATITKIELDSEAGRGIYDIELVLNQYEYDLKLDAKTGSGISIKKELRDGASNTTQLSKNYITKEQAKNAALGHIPGATVLKVELDKDDAVYELELRKGNVKYDVVVSAITGKVLSSEIDD